jgi:hypothetical protein
MSVDESDPMFTFTAEAVVVAAQGNLLSSIMSPLGVVEDNAQIQVPPMSPA